MTQKTISLADVVVLETRQEDHFFDRKALAASGKTVQKISVALANADGGEFVIGIADAEERSGGDAWSGATQIEDFNPHIQALAEIMPPVPADYSVLVSPDRHGFVLLVRIEKSPNVHQTADGTVYARRGAQSLPLKEQERILDLQFAKGAASFEDQVVTTATTGDVVDAEELKAFLSAYSPKSEPLEFALNQNLIDRKSWEPRVAGVVLFNANPASTLPRKCSAKIARYETREEDPERDHLKQTWPLEGPL